MAKLAAYNPKAKCPKCGNAKVATRYRGIIEEDPLWFDRTYRDVGKWPEHEYQHRTCERCHYEWPERIARALTGEDA